MTDTVSLETSRRDLSLNCLKFIAAAAMLIDRSEERRVGKEC